KTAGVDALSGRVQSTTGANTITGVDYPGLAYDPVQDRIVGWNGGNTVYLLNTGTWTWTTVSFTGGPARLANGTNGRWRYSPASNLFVVRTSVPQNASPLRLTQTSSAVPSPVGSLLVK